MQIAYTVHSYAEELVPVTVELEGQQVEAKVPGIVVELTSGQDTLTLRRRPDDLEAARALFVVGSTIVATFTPQE